MKAQFCLLFLLLPLTQVLAQDERPAPQTGRYIYRHKCGGCHGLDGKADNTMGKTYKMRDLTSPEVQARSDEELAHVIGYGQDRMPSFRMILGDQRIRAVVGYLRRLQSESEKR